MNRSTKIVVGTSTTIGLFVLTLCGYNSLSRIPQTVSTIQSSQPVTSTQNKTANIVNTTNTVNTVKPTNTVKSNSNTANKTSNTVYSNSESRKIPNNNPKVFPTDDEYNITKIYRQPTPEVEGDISTSIDTFIDRFNRANEILLTIREFDIQGNYVHTSETSDWIEYELSTENSPSVNCKVSIVAFHANGRNIERYHFRFNDSDKVPAEKLAYFLTLCTYAAIPSISDKEIKSFNFSSLKYNTKDTILLTGQYKDYTIEVSSDKTGIDLVYSPTVTK